MYGAVSILIVIFISMSVSLYNVKYKYIFLDQEFRTLCKDIQNLLESLHILEAEWAHLNHPTRLEILSQKYLKMIPVSPKPHHSSNPSTSTIPKNHNNDSKPDCQKPELPQPATLDLFFNTSNIKRHV